MFLCLITLYFSKKISNLPGEELASGKMLTLKEKTVKIKIIRMAVLFYNTEQGIIFVLQSC